jgi:hypothetical protein
LHIVPVHKAAETGNMQGMLFSRELARAAPESPVAGAGAAVASAAPLGFTDGQLEAIKWLAMASMLLDHVGRLLLGHGESSWVFALSRTAFPLFALALALNLARPGDAGSRSLRTARRLALWCLVATVPAIWARGQPWLVNVLGTLALGALACWAFESPRSIGQRLAVLLATVAVSPWVEFDLPGVLLVLAFFLAARHRQAHLFVLAAVLLGLTGWLNAVFGGAQAFAGTLAIVPIAWAMRLLPMRIPRVQFLFYLAYPAHLAVIGVLRQAWIG